MHLPGQALDHKSDAFTPVFQQLVPSFALDDINGNFNLAVPIHLKLDVDGIELKIVHDADKALINPLIKSMRVEID